MFRRSSSTPSIYSAKDASGERQRTVLKKKPTSSHAWSSWSPEGMEGHSKIPRSKSILNSPSTTIISPPNSPSKERSRNGGSIGFHRPSNYQSPRVESESEGNPGFKAMRSSSLSSLQSSQEQRLSSVKRVEVPPHSLGEVPPLRDSFFQLSDDAVFGKYSSNSKTKSTYSPPQNITNLPSRSNRSQSASLPSRSKYLSTFQPSADPYLSTFRNSPSVDEQLSRLSNSSQQSRTLQTTRTSSKNIINFNIIILGPQGSGKSSLVKQLCYMKDGRGDISKITRTKEASEIQFELNENGEKRVLVKIKDTVGLEMENKFLLDEQVKSIVNDLESRFLDSLQIESQVDRKKVNDSHFHLLIYTIHPDSIKPKPIIKKVEPPPSPIFVPELPPLAATSTSITRKSSIIRDQRIEMSNYRLRSQSNPSTPPKTESSLHPPPSQSRTSTPVPKIESINPLTPVKNENISLPMVVGMSRSRSNSSTKLVRPSLTRLGSVEKEIQRKLSIEELEIDPDELSMSAEDLRIIKRLGELITILPVLAKSDRLTVVEIEKYKKVIKRDLMGVIDLKLFDGEEELEELMATSALGFINSSTEGEMEVEEEVEEPKVVKLTRSRSNSIRSFKSRKSISNLKYLVPTSSGGREKINLPLLMVGAEFGEEFEATGELSRTFRYGKIDILDPEQTDLRLLSNTIFGTHLTKIKAQSKEFYERFRTVRLSRRGYGVVEEKPKIEKVV